MLKNMGINEEDLDDVVFEEESRRLRPPAGWRLPKSSLTETTQAFGFTKIRDRHGMWLRR
jgi:hypothetical protein